MNGDNLRFDGMMKMKIIKCGKTNMKSEESEQIKREKKETTG